MSLRQAQQIARKLLGNSKPIIFLLLFSYIIAIIPEKLEVHVPDFSHTDQVKAAYEQLLIENTKQNTEDAIAFDTMMVDINEGEAVITYKVAPGDSLAKIAKKFGTTSEELARTNNIENLNRLRTGQLLVISYEEGVPYEIVETQTAREFALANDLNLEDFLTVNYFSEGEMTLEEGWQVILPLNEREAQKKGLIPKEQFVMLDLEEENEEGPELLAFVETDQQKGEQVNTDSKTPGSDTGYVQTVITADETEQRLKDLEQEAMQIEENTLPEAENEEDIVVVEETPQEPQPEVFEEQPVEVEEIQEDPTEDPNPCADDQCFFNNECWTKPEHAHCVPEDTQNAWKCSEGYEESRKSCVKLPEPEPVIEDEPEVLLADLDEQQDAADTTSASSSAGTIVAQWYTNYVAQEDYAYNGFGAGHCTELADYMFQKNHGIDARELWRGGNAYQRPDRARNAGLVVNTTPGVGAVAYTNISGYRSRYGHLVYVTKVNYAEGTLEVIDQNYVGRHVTTKRIIAMDDVIEYIHPRFQ